MNKLSCLVVIAALTAAAHAVDGRLFITGWLEGYGLVQPDNFCTPTFSDVTMDGDNYNALDYYYGTGPFVVGAFPPADYPGYGIDNPLEFYTAFPADGACLWLQFDASLAKNTKINGLEVQVRDAATDEIVPGFAPVVYYLQNDVGASGNKRWDGPATSPHYPEYTGNNPQILVAVSAFGLQKREADQLDQLYTGADGGYIALLGSICLDPPYTIGTYYVSITDINYLEGEGLAENWISDAYFYVPAPEPTSVMLLALGALLLRRR